MEFLKVDGVDAAREKLIYHTAKWNLITETLSSDKILDRVISEDVYSGEDIPGFRRSTVDGFAVLSADTSAAGESLPVFLKKAGIVVMGQSAGISVTSGECVEIPTGGMIPEGADAVVMLEYAESFGMEGTAFYRSAAHGENVVQSGEDVKKGALILRRGKRVLAQDIGILAAAGITSANVYGKPRITILSTGDELISVKDNPKLGQVRDINTGALTALALKNGYSVVKTDVLPDDSHVLEEAIFEAMPSSEIVIVSGGSSKGKKDATLMALGNVAHPGVFTHGIAVKPGKPTILGYDEGTDTLVAGLPGHPVSAMMVFELLFGWLIREVMGTSAPPAIPAKLTCNLASSPGKLTCFPVKLEKAGELYSAVPIFGKSGLISTLTRADGWCAVPRASEGLQSGQTVMVNLF